MLSRHCTSITGLVLATCAGIFIWFGLFALPATEVARLGTSSLEERFLFPQNSRHGEHEDRIVYLNWNAGSPTLYSDPTHPLKLSALKSIRVEHCITPEVFVFLREAKELEILRLQIRQTNKFCAFDGVNLIPKLRSLLVYVFGDECELANCNAIAQCDRLESIWFAGGLRVSVTDLRELSASKTIKFACFNDGCKRALGAISELSNLNSLKELSLENPTSSDIHELSKITSLEGIYLGFGADDSITTLADLKKLPKLKLLQMYVEEERRDQLRATLPGVNLVFYNDPR